MTIKLIQSNNSPISREEWILLTDHHEIEPAYDERALEVIERKSAGNERFMGMIYNLAKQPRRGISHGLDYLTLCYVQREILPKDPEPFKGLTNLMAEFYEASEYFGFPENYSIHVHDQLDYQI